MAPHTMGVLGSDARMPGGARKERDLFPLPSMRAPLGVPTGLSREVVGRVARRMEEDLRLNESVDALNTWEDGKIGELFRPRRKTLASVGEAGVRHRQILHGLLDDHRRFLRWEREDDSQESRMRPIERYSGRP